VGGRPGTAAGPAAAVLRVILVDTSAWVEYLRATGHVSDQRLRSLIEKEQDLATTEPVVMEVLAGARDEGHASRLRRLLLRTELVPVEGLTDYEQAAAVYRRCRTRGETVRRIVDCLIAAVAIRTGVAVLHADGDFDAIARHTALAIDDAGAR
jgi:predicted nucleic acid-binding protein